MTTANKRKTTIILSAIAWAVAFIASAILFKGNPAKDWIQAVLFVIGTTLWLFQAQRLARRGC